MESTTSVSKGVFLFPNGYNNGKKSKKKSLSIFESTFSNEQWYRTFKMNWDEVEDQLRILHEMTHSVLLNDIVSYLKISQQGCELNSCDKIIPCITLLTGVNQPDHVDQFKSLIGLIREDVSPHVAMVNSQDAPTLKHLVENTVWQLINDDNLVGDLEDSLDESSKPKLKKSRCTMKTLQSWYNDNLVKSPKKRKKSQLPLVVIIPDFESFNCNVLQDFVMIISSYISTLPVVLIFGVATSVSALHKSFPYQVSSKLLIKVFHSQPSHVYMNQVLENIFLTHSSPFHLSGKAFELLTDVFLFYDFSVTGIIQSIKYCMMDFFYADNIKSLCGDREKLNARISKLTSDDLENIRRLLSFRPFLEVQDCQTKIGLFEDDNFFKEVLQEELHKLHDYLFSFYLSLRLLAVFVKDLPKNVMGKSVREIYAKCATEHIVKTEAFKESMQLINFQSKVQLLETIQSAIKVVNNALQSTSPGPLRSPTKNMLNKSINSLGEEFVKNIKIHFVIFRRQIENASTEVTVQEEDDDDFDLRGSRHKLKEKLLKATRVDRIQSEFMMIRSRFVNYLEEIFEKSLLPPHTQTFHEILFFTEVSNVKKQIVGAPRGALHVALSNPQCYLQCKCCTLPSLESVSDTIPDVSLAYKLHRECGKHINLYDWLQAFAAILCPDSEDPAHDPNIQVRFTRAVAELQFLGFIKTSKRKTDHVMRLTW
ncbi:origin recognition complex subunit 3 [Pieris napi]|uniref:origin recognition complex subunit 3 n=1 Tax=Pieris napi TaxID=78633 RepID=UPI001FBB9F67|nr:origin recognition complex subunit 3 [Pieris napi]